MHGTVLTQKWDRQSPLVGPRLIPIQMVINDRKEDYGMAGPESVKGRSSLGAYLGFLGT
jgi:hypothetical protein